MDLLTAARMRAIEEEAIGSGEVTGLELMERAGHGVLDAIFATWPELAPLEAERLVYFEGDSPKTALHRAVVLCGPGNNGGDGFVVARLLREHGWEVDVHLFGDPEKLPPDARTNHDRWSAVGAVVRFEDENFSGQVGREPDAILFVDALFGTGLTRPVEGFDNLAAMLLEARDHAGMHVVSVDVPSGLCADSGRYLRRQGDDPDRAAIMADLTVTFHRAKAGQFLADGPDACGRVVVADIGLASSGPAAIRAAEPNRSGLFKRNASHKYAHGHALVVSGGPGRTGAARLAARGALRIGAGLVTLACPLRALPEAAAQVTAVMLRGLDGPSGLSEILEDRRFNAVCLGPGLGLGQVTAELVKVVLESQRACVLDADALTRFQRAPNVLFDMLNENCVLTPHAGEFERLFPEIAEKLDVPADSGPAYSKLDATREAAARAGCVILFKGPDTVIAAPDGRASVNSAAYHRAAPWLATAGAGDVLAGFITGLLARGFDPMTAAETAAWLHVDCARSFGPGLVAEDLAEELPNVLSRLFAAT